MTSTTPTINGPSNMNTSAQRNKALSNNTALVELHGAASGEAWVASLSEKDKGLAYWEDWCLEEGYDRMPTWKTILQYVREFVVPLEDMMNRAILQDPIKSPPMAGTRVFVEPVLRLKEQEEERLGSTTRNSAFQSEPIKARGSVAGPAAYAAEPTEESESADPLPRLDSSFRSMLDSRITTSTAHSPVRITSLETESLLGSCTTRPLNAQPTSSPNPAKKLGSAADLTQLNSRTGSTSASNSSSSSFTNSSKPTSAGSKTLVGADTGVIIKEEEAELVPYLSTRSIRSSVTLARSGTTAYSTMAKVPVASTTRSASQLSRRTDTSTETGSKEVAQPTLELRIKQELEEPPLLLQSKGATLSSGAKPLSSRALLLPSSSSTQPAPKGRESIPRQSAIICHSIKEEPQVLIASRIESSNDTERGLMKSSSTGPKLSIWTANHDDLSQFKAEEFILPRRGCENTFKTAKLPLIPQYSMNDNVKTIVDVLREWRFGFQGGPAIQDLNFEYGGQWKLASDKNKYLHRTAAVKAYVELVTIKGLKDEEAISTLQRLMGQMTWRTLYRYIRDSRLDPESGRKRKRVSRGGVRTTEDQNVESSEDDEHDGNDTEMGDEEK
ncbi:hypothetical protein BGZ83_004204 [Gryganskiella cystojenkinii]|nr:hypothetical protein BGZ83_004204 [Gryganskiella cystojenkinii]